MSESELLTTWTHLAVSATLLLWVVSLWCESIADDLEQLIRDKCLNRKESNS